MNIQNLFDDAKCFQTIRDMRWPNGVACPSRGSASVVKNGRDGAQSDRQRHERGGCRNRFDDLTGTVFAGHHRPPRVRITCLYLTGLNLSGLRKEPPGPGTLIHTDEYEIHGRLKAWGYQHCTACHGKGERARDEDGDGFHEVHVNTIEGFRPLLRSWLRPHRGIPQETLPPHPAFFQVVHNVSARGMALLGSLIAQLAASPWNPS